MPDDRPDGYVRVWLSAHLVISRAVPGAVVDYAASRALKARCHRAGPRACFVTPAKWTG